MEDVIKIASYIKQRYGYQYGTDIDEEKLYQLLYFTQRENMVETGLPMFADSFSANKGSLIIPSVHIAYKSGELHSKLSNESLANYQSVFDHVFKTYASKDAIGLSTLIQNEYSWVKSTKGNGEECIVQIGDIAKDAARIRNRRFLLKHLSEFRKPAYV